MMQAIISDANGNEVTGCLMLFKQQVHTQKDKVKMMR